MITFNADYFDGKTSRAYHVTVTCDARYLHIYESDSLRLEVSIQDCILPPALGKTSRSIRLPNRGLLVSGDSKAIADLESLTGRSIGMRAVHFLENHRKMVMWCFLGLILCVWIFISYGIPLLAQKAALLIPPDLTEKVSRKTMEALDGRYFSPTELDRRTSRRLQTVFREIVNDIGSDHHYRLELRKSPVVGPNALALPSGIIILTDELVGIAQDENELKGVLLHEIAHVEKRHGMRRAIQNAGVVFLISLLAGDITSVTSTADSLPKILAQSGYSRTFEREADESVVMYFIQRGMNIDPYIHILLRIAANQTDYPGKSLFSSHPLTKQRIEYLRALEKSLSQ